MNKIIFLLVLLSPALVFAQKTYYAEVNDVNATAIQLGLDPDEVRKELDIRNDRVTEIEIKQPNTNNIIKAKILPNKDGKDNNSGAAFNFISKEQFNNIKNVDLDKLNLGNIDNDTRETLNAPNDIFQQAINKEYLNKESTPNPRVKSIQEDKIKQEETNNYQEKTVKSSNGYTGSLYNELYQKDN